MRLKKNPQYTKVSADFEKDDEMRLEASHTLQDTTKISHPDCTDANTRVWWHGRGRRGNALSVTSVWE